MAKKKSMAVVMVDSDLCGEPSAYEAALTKAADPLMTTAGNPLAEDPGQGLQDRIISTNMERLHQDAKKRRGPNGAVYASFMNQRFGG